MVRHGKKAIRDFLVFDNMSTEALKEILRLDFQSDEDSDMDAILYIMGVVAKREKENPSAEYTDVHAAWESFLFLKNYLPYAGPKSLYDLDKDGDDEDTPLDVGQTSLKKDFRPQKRPRLMYAACIAAVISSLLLAGTITASALGFDLWGTVVKWTKDTFRFVSADTIETSKRYNSLQDALSDYGITEPLAPKWIPDGYEFKSIDVSETPETTKFLAIYMDDGNELMISILSLADSNTNMYEKDADKVIIYETGGIKHYLMSNEGRLNAVWLYDSYECLISGNITESEIEKMIDSIYER